MPNPENVLPHRWKPGQSGNPNGYSRGRRITDALIKLIEEKSAEKPLASRWLHEALNGDPKFFAMLLERIEGRVEQRIDFAETHDAPHRIPDVDPRFLGRHQHPAVVGPEKRDDPA